MSARATLLRLRPPCGRNTVVTCNFAREITSNGGYTVRFPSVSEPVVAMADGLVVKVDAGHPSWRTDIEVMRNLATFNVTVDHGYGIESFVAGLSRVEVSLGAQVRRGQRLGLPATLEIFYDIHSQGTKHPAFVNRHFKVYPKQYVLEPPPQTVRFAPDVAPGRDLAEGLMPTLGDEWRIYYRQPGAPLQPYLVNVDFAGSGAKRGKAAVGVGQGDYWNLYTQTDFTATTDFTCGPVTVYSSIPVLWLKDYLEKDTTVRLEKETEPAAIYQGTASGASWDPMLATWMGGYDVFTPRRTSFVLKGLPSGPARVLLYSSHGATTFSLSVDGAAPVSKTSSFVPNSAFTPGVNYVEFLAYLEGGSSGLLGVQADGFLSGMQISRA